MSTSRQPEPSTIHPQQRTGQTLSKSRESSWPTRVWDRVSPRDLKRSGKWA